jgi:hypothetical protein
MNISDTENHAIMSTLESMHDRVSKLETRFNFTIGMKRGGVTGSDSEHTSTISDKSSEVSED